MRAGHIDGNKSLRYWTKGKQPYYGKSSEERAVDEPDVLVDTARDTGY